MEEVHRLEMLSESIKNEIDELQSLLENSDGFLLKAKSKSVQDHLKNIISNLESANDGVYGVFEDLNAQNNEEWKDKCDLMEDILKDKLTYEEKTYMRIKHNIDIY